MARWQYFLFLRMMLSMMEVMEVVGVMLPKTLAKLTCWNMMLLWLMMMVLNKMSFTGCWW